MVRLGIKNTWFGFGKDHVLDHEMSQILIKYIYLFIAINMTRSYPSVSLKICSNTCIQMLKYHVL